MNKTTTMWELWGLLLGVTLLAAVPMSWVIVRNREMRGARAMGILAVGMVLWVISELVQLYFGQFQGNIARAEALGMPIRILGIDITVIGIFILGIEYTGRDRWLCKKLYAALSIKPLATMAVVLFEPSILYATLPDSGSPWGYVLVPETLWPVHVVYAFVFVLAGLWLLAHMMWKANYAYRLRITILLVSIFIPLSINAAFNLELLPFDLTPGGFLFTATIVVVGIFRWRLMDAAPVARRTVLERIDDLVFVVDDGGTVTTVNAAVTERFGDVRGGSIEEVFDVPELAEPSSGDQEMELTVQFDDDVRYFEVDGSVLTDYRGDFLGKVIVARDVTEARRREEQLELLKDVQSRFVRHNLRNELNSVLAHAEFMFDGNDTGPPPEESYDVIVDTCQRLVAWGEKARTIERLVESAERRRKDPGADVLRIVERLREEYPDVRFELDCSTGVDAMTVPQIEDGLEALIENAAEYNDSDDPRVRISTEVTDEQIQVVIEDNGPGIDEGELEALQAGRETQLKHSSGFGLWLAYWVVETSEGEIDFEVDDGTIVTLTFERADKQTLVRKPT